MTRDDVHVVHCTSRTRSLQAGCDADLTQRPRSSQRPRVLHALFDVECNELHELFDVECNDGEAFLLLPRARTRVRHCPDVYVGFNLHDAHLPGD